MPLPGLSVTVDVVACVTVAVRHRREQATAEASELVDRQAFDAGEASQPGSAALRIVLRDAVAHRAVRVAADVERVRRVGAARRERHGEDVVEPGARRRREDAGLTGRRHPEDGAVLV